MDNLLILERLDRLEKLCVGHKEVLTFDEACYYTGISRIYLYKHTASSKIPPTKPNCKILFFEKVKLVEWLLQNKRKSQHDIEAEALAYTLSHKVQ